MIVRIPNCGAYVDVNFQSPFPGMNPYLEQAGVWHDFHDSLLPALRDALMERLPEHYVCKLEEQVYVHEVEESSSQFLGRADVAVLPVRPFPAAANETAGTIVVPVQVELVFPDVERLVYLEIQTADSSEVVAVIELLSPANKRPGKDRDQYLAKRDQVLQSSVHLVEIDLLRRWPRMPAREIPPCDYCLLVSDARRRPMADVWPFSLKQPIPALRVPLLEIDAPVEIDLQAVFERVFVGARYARFIYKHLPDPPLSESEAAWAEELIAAAAS